jgi:pimeloyl-ACP methyl ester carboxylesterase
MQVGDAVAVLKAAEFDRAAVIGLNDGTIVAALLAAQRPELCRALVLLLSLLPTRSLPGCRWSRSMR